jgi:hypothetical protein
MDYIDDCLYVYKKAIKDTADTILKAPFAIFLSLIYSLLFFGIKIFSLKTGLGFTPIWGVIYGLIEAAVLSSYFTQLNSAVYRNTLNLESAGSGFGRYLWSIYFVNFVFYILGLLFGNIMRTAFVSLVFYFVLNAIGETIYLKENYGAETFSYSVNFVFENLHIWIVHMILAIVIERFFGTLVQNPLDMYIGIISLRGGRDILISILRGVYILFRGVLYRNLMSSSMRKRSWNRRVEN